MSCGCAELTTVRIRDCHGRRRVTSGKQKAGRAGSDGGHSGSEAMCSVARPPGGSQGHGLHSPQTHMGQLELGQTCIPWAACQRNSNMVHT